MGGGVGGADTASCEMFDPNPYVLSFATSGSGSLSGSATQYVTAGGSTTAVNAIPSTGLSLRELDGGWCFTTTTNNR